MAIKAMQIKVEATRAAAVVELAAERKVYL